MSDTLSSSLNCLPIHPLAAGLTHQHRSTAPGDMGRSELANTLSTRELSRRLDKKGVATVYANSFFPGNIPTQVMDTLNHHFCRITGTLFKSMFRVIG
ncbi:hypothetical protein AOQ84DRAFT_371598 [Glonium stellatum]|uniref:Uncharacterized protein n=1 Tax=Glonium stellatum TaxID=574774 RepID=A0A8E2FBS0_9PEZI|nr:hypothetical protein AOQ84DRAFT_371598 [Glonium stellatum]